MKYRKFKQGKLWRDKAVDLLKEMGSKIHWMRLEGEQFEEQLRVKLLEEAAEVSEAKNKEGLLEELADLLEVISAFCELYEVNLEDIVKLQAKKRDARGGFHGRKFVTVAEHPIGSFAERYCLNDQDKYPEIFD